MAIKNDGNVAEIVVAAISTKHSKMADIKVWSETKKVILGSLNVLQNTIRFQIGTVEQIQSNPKVSLE